MLNAKLTSLKRILFNLVYSGVDLVQALDGNKALILH